MFHWGPTVHLDTVEHLDPAEAFAGVESQSDREEIVWTSTNTELETAALVV